MPRNWSLLSALAVLALGAAWWLALHRLTAEERRLVGTWRQQCDPACGGATWTFRADRTCDLAQFGPPATGGEGCAYVTPSDWSARDGRIYVVHRESPLGRAKRSACHLLRIPILDGNVFVPESMSAGRMVFALPDGSLQTWTKDPAK